MLDCQGGAGYIDARSNSPNFNMISQYITKRPIIPESVFIAEGARIVGDVTLGEDCTVWFNAIVRGDVHSIRVGDRTNIQDGAIIHCTLNKYSVTIGSDVTIAHGAIVHGCTIHDHALIGMGAKVLDRAVVHSFSMIAAGAVVREGFEVPPRTLVAGVPAKTVRELTEEEVAMIRSIPANYIQYAKEYREHMPSTARASVGV